MTSGNRQRHRFDTQKNSGNDEVSVDRKKHLAAAETPR
jgi:hypothetical protein